MGAAPVTFVAAGALLGLSSAALLALSALGAVVGTVATVTMLLRPLAHDAVDARIRAQDADERNAALRLTVVLRDRFDAAAAAEESEAGVLRLLVRAATELVSDAEVTLLLSLPTEARIAWSVRMVDGELVPAVPVAGRPGCVALASGSTATIASSHELGACEHLRSGKDHGVDLDPFDVSATCLALPLGDRTLGVLCVSGPPGESVDVDQLAVLEHLARTAGRRLDARRRRRGPSVPGPTDAVTGLPTDVALRSRAGELTRAHQQYCLAVLQVDGAAEFRATHSPDAFDDALRLVADTTSTTLRPDDVVVRLDGDRIAAVLANCSTVQGAAALERVRVSLVLALTVAGVAHFTCSAGLVDGARSTSVDDAIRLADAAGQTALLQGGNRVVVADASFT